MKKVNKLWLLILVILAVSCSKSENEGVIKDITGFVQKGPFISGSSVTVYNLRTDLTPDGKSYNTQIVNNQGFFQLDDLELSSDYARIRADGFYFNEVTGTQSVAQISLYALADVTGAGAVNVNLLTHLEKPRVEFLMESGKSFAEAKKQAQQEILAIFNMEKEQVGASENLDISQGGEDNGILLAISCILQGFRTEGELTELLANISNDIREDGRLDSPALGTALINHATLLSSKNIQSNLAKRYHEQDVAASIPDFGALLRNFIIETDFEPSGSFISYPENGAHGPNILALSQTEYESGQDNPHSLAADLPKNSELKIQITCLSSSDTIITTPDDTTDTGELVTWAAWYYGTGSGINWSIADFDMQNYTQTFTAIESNKSCDLNIYFDRGTFLIEYFEMDSSEPSSSKTITMK